MSSEERDMILEMVAENKISTSEAADLLDALDTVEQETRDDELFRAESADVQRSERDLRRAERDMRRRDRDMERETRRRERESRRVPGFSSRSLLIHVRDGEDTRTHVRVPLGMALAATKFIPKKARDYFDEYGIDLTDLLDSVANNLGRTGEIVNIRDGEKRVEVSIIGGDPDEEVVLRHYPGERNQDDDSSPTPSFSPAPAPPAAPEAPQAPQAPDVPAPPA